MLVCVSGVSVFVCCVCVLCVSFVCRSCVVRVSFVRATAKCGKHCELHESANHLKVERILIFRFSLESMFSYDGGGSEV